ncbi:DUF445 domain-containing protein [Proteocatella sphenisci]|uniref:DUF445 domain-containing protein n=1 Tax=Proteocatella sphenisci TaxID=181070 RepID=UPI00048DA05B|nr:DUF445 family protein [Proteocatella sphenisci]
MQLFLKIMFMVVVGGLIGWMTNVIAIKLLFRPLLPVKIPLINFHIIGLIPKRRFDIARNIGQTVHDELISMDEIGEKLLTDENKNWIADEIKGKISTVIDEKMSILPSSLKMMAMGMFGDVVDKEISVFIDEKSGELIKKAGENVNIGEMVEEKINQFELEKIEEIILSVAKSELKHIEVLGGFLGAAIGLFQAVVMQFLW